MHLTTALLALAGAALAQNSSTDPSLCDKYTTALFKENNATNQATLITLLVNTAVIGNYTTSPAPKNTVPGILAKGMFNGEEVNLLPYFDGTLVSTNGGGKAVSVNFLDDGGAEPLKKNMPANSMDSKQYKLLTHLYQFFSALLKCSTYGTTPANPSYSGRDMASSHAFMALDPSEVGYFITQVGLSAASFGVAQEDVTAVGEALNKLFGYKCSPPAVVIPEKGETLNSICQNEKCPLDAMAKCEAYPNNGTVAEPMMVGENGSMNGTNATGTGSPMPPMQTTSLAASGRVWDDVLVVLGAVVFAVAL
ncbi:unnamed protein product [Periconia digitata]|uniref:Uncharacterized protein n=1 Tax=Periconia digitata TaxID=1303443 RepID=A0A9W4XCU7_9PLEO|nr:unnamed protein product [Periconia digitata]